MKELSKAYEPKNYEDKIYKKWEESGLFNPDVCIAKGIADKNADYFSIVLPPPNVTGTLHMGHAVMLAIQDVLARYHRMQGDRTLWVPGTDHAAIATQAKVEKLLIEKGIKNPRQELGREKFLVEVKKFAQESHDIIVSQCRKMGASLDWSREAFTLDEQRNLAVRAVFKKMYDDGLIYRGYRIVNWCPYCLSTLADDEVVYKEQVAKLYTFKYDKDFPIAISTTRPETKLGDTAVAVNPKDKRYKKYIGKVFAVKNFAGLPVEALAKSGGPDLKIKVIASDEVDMNFGTGALGVTPAHSLVDFDMAQKNKLPIIKVIGEDGKITKEAGKNYEGLTVKEARQKVVEYLQQNSLMEKEEEVKNNLSVCYRCETPIEPLPSKQWFIDVNKPIKARGKKSLKQLMQKAVGNKKGQIKIIPDRFEKIYFHWIDNLRDWCISRQIWYGHRIPVYYCKQGNPKSQIPNPKCAEPIVSIDEIKKCLNCDGEVAQDPDTLDTWFSSGLWTFSTLGYPNLEAPDLKNYHPTSVMETGYDILFFWVARMILMTTYVLGDIPFKTVYLHGLVRDEQGRKMSKSLGNVIDPLDMIAKYGTDATRLSLLVGNMPGNDMKLSEEKIAGFRNFTNKLWNISRFMLMNIENPKINIAEPKAKTLADKWILGNLNAIISKTSENIEKYNFSLAGEQLRDFTWGDLADWYLEIAKVEGGKSEILNYILNIILKLWHPYMPFVTETIWQEVYGVDKMLMIEKLVENKKVKTKTKDFEIIKNIITGIRSLRAEYKIEPTKKLNAGTSTTANLELLQENKEIIVSLARLADYQIAKKIEPPKNSTVLNLDTSTTFAVMDIDKDKEKARLEHEIENMEKFVTILKNKLDNKEFKAKAPNALVVAEGIRLDKANEILSELKKSLSSFS